MRIYIRWHGWYRWVNVADRPSADEVKDWTRIPAEWQRMRVPIISSDELRHMAYYRDSDIGYRVLLRLEPVPDSVTYSVLIVLNLTDTINEGMWFYDVEET